MEASLRVKSDPGAMAGRGDKADSSPSSNRGAFFATKTAPLSALINTQKTAMSDIAVFDKLKNLKIRFRVPEQQPGCQAC